MVTKFECLNCKNDNAEQASYYDGMLGYSAIVCKKCGTYVDHFGWHEPDEWSLKYVGLNNNDNEKIQSNKRIQ